MNAGETFDEPLNPALFEAPKPRVPRPERTSAAPTLAPSGDFVVGKPQNMREPKNPLQGMEKEGKQKGGGFWMKLIGAVVGGLICGVIGFFAGGPLGAAIGFAAGAVGGWMVTH